MKQRLTFRLAALLILFSLILTGCSEMKSVLTVNGEKQNAGYYSFYIHWQRDYMKELMKNAGYDIGAHINDQYSDTETVREYIISTAKDRYLSYIAVTRKFDELGLTLSDEKKQEVETLFRDEWVAAYGEDGIKNILSQLELSETEFMSLLAVQTKSDALLEYYYGENGQTPVTLQMKKDYFNENYLRFKYVLLSTKTEDGTALPEDEIRRKQDLAKTLTEQGGSFEELVAQYSEDYTAITDGMTEEERTAAENTNRRATEDGIICDKNGVFNQTLYQYYDISVNANVITALQGMEVGQVRSVETDNAIWVVKKYDLNESETYFSEREAAIYQALYGEDFSAKYTRWLAELNYVFDETALAEFDPANFSDLFTDLYHSGENAASDKP